MPSFMDTVSLAYTSFYISLFIVIAYLCVVASVTTPEEASNLLSGSKATLDTVVKKPLVRKSCMRKEGPRTRTSSQRRVHFRTEPGKPDTDLCELFVHEISESAELGPCIIQQCQPHILGDRFVRPHPDGRIDLLKELGTYLPPTFRCPWEARCMTKRKIMHCAVCKHNPRLVGRGKWVDWKGNSIPLDVVLAELDFEEFVKKPKESFCRGGQTPFINTPSPVKKTPLIYFT